MFKPTEEDYKSYINRIILLFINYLQKEVELEKINEDYVTSIINILPSDSQSIKQNRVYTNFVQTLILVDVMRGKFPTRVTVTNNLPFVFQKDEKLIWLSNDIDYYEDKVMRHYEGGSIGMSFRLANGFYLRANEFKGKPVETTSQKFISRGIAGYTNKHIYFFSPVKSFKIKYDKIISIIPGTDGIIIMKDGASSKPITLKNEEGLFIYNLVNSLTKQDLTVL